MKAFETILHELQGAIWVEGLTIINQVIGDFLLFGRCAMNPLTVKVKGFCVGGGGGTAVPHLSMQAGLCLHRKLGPESRLWPQLSGGACYPLPDPSARSLASASL